ncbi:MAG TPA: type VII secretion protein EccE [Pilimelia sp.]|nr:type VII secretion protein EccE [Pilimelia sp.]
MSAPPQAMRAVARAAVEAPRDRAAPPILLPRRRPGHLGPLHITQLLLAEVVLVAVAATLTRSAVAAAGVALVGAVLLLFALGRRQGRWWLEQRLMARRYRRRRRDTAGMPYGADPRLAALRRLAPGLVVNDVAVADGAQVGVARDDAGWYAVAALTPNPPARDDPGGVPLDVIAAALAEAEQPGAVLQVVTRTVPAPSVKIHPSSPAGQSYRRLLARFGAPPVPADRDTWVAVRLEARMLAEAVTDAGADLDAVPAVVAALVRRVARSLRHVGVRHRLLDADALLDALVRSCDLEPPSPPEMREDWSAWHSSRLAHRSFWIRGWPAPALAGGLLNWLSTAAAAMTSVALVIVPDEDPQLVDLRALVRVAAPEGDLAAVCQALTDGAREAGADLFPLDGEQGPAVYASAPTGGGAR